MGRAPITVVDADPVWPLVYEEEAGRIRNVWAGDLLTIEHVGSTSVAGLPAKPIIDVLLVVREVPPPASRIEGMRGLGYEYRGEHGMVGRAYFSKPPPRPFHVHAYQPGHVQIQLSLRFRDRLRADQAAAADYAALKRELAQRFPADRDLYTALKTSFIHRHTGRRETALAEVALGTPRLGEAVRFYQRVLGVLAEPAGERAFVLRMDEVALRLEPDESASAPARLVFRVHDVDDWCTWLREAGFEIAPPARLIDPDGRAVELI